MATTSKRAKQSLIEKAAYGALGMATKVNDFALKTTERAFTKSFEMSEKCVGVTGKIVKKGLQVSAAQQEMTFDILESIKKKVIKK
ncbi:hypothetical protein EAX61_06805 [Dokdonia sinensis]|uniref:Uncharacterized protein n=1 Tax=Dokdonia sinensis TaxID=2479847 RepID=A0A3M0G6H1_9FLAO|nr:hypothetical protein [Dokdonia sinensis]RMB60525.1 hypothetical protein EAX61_06805 [Dokdonia sinensis]